jgi:NAD(P)-dependent dehydrogenase (short-subunit alcohol dehydrogenase family)
VKACFTLTQASPSHMRKRGGGRIIITSSVTGPKVSMPGSGAYPTSKAAVTGFIHTGAIELAADNIAVNAIQPGYIDTYRVCQGLMSVPVPDAFPISPRPNVSVSRRRSAARWCSWGVTSRTISQTKPLSSTAVLRFPKALFAG